MLVHAEEGESPLKTEALYFDFEPTFPEPLYLEGDAAPRVAIVIPRANVAKAIQEGLGEELYNSLSTKQFDDLIARATKCEEVKDIASSPWHILMDEAWIDDPEKGLGPLNISSQQVIKADDVTLKKSLHALVKGGSDPTIIPFEWYDDKERKTKYWKPVRFHPGDRYYLVLDLETLVGKEMAPKLKYGRLIHKTKLATKPMRIKLDDRLEVGLSSGVLGQDKDLITAQQVGGEFVKEEGNFVFDEANMIRGNLTVTQKGSNWGPKTSKSFYTFSFDSTLSTHSLDSASSIEMFVSGPTASFLRMPGTMTIHSFGIRTSQNLARTSALFSPMWRIGDKRSDASIDYEALTCDSFFPEAECMDALYFELGFETGYTVIKALDRVPQDDLGGAIFRPRASIGFNKELSSKMGVSITGRVDGYYLPGSLGRALETDRWAYVGDVTLGVGTKTKGFQLSATFGDNPAAGFKSTDLELGLKFFWKS